MKRIMAIGIASGLIAAGTAAAQAFSDTGTSPYTDAIDRLQSMGIVQGYADGAFRPQAPINRAEFLTLLINAQYPERTPSDLRCFQDLDVKTPQWYAGPVCLGLKLGIVHGYPDGTFRPESTVNLVEAFAMTFRAYAIPVTSSGESWYRPLLAEARSRRILLPLLSSPAHNLTRGEMASMIDALMNDDGESSSSAVTTATCGDGKLEGREECDKGTQNGQEDSGCSSICLSLVDPPRRGLLQIQERPTTVTPVIAAGQTNLPLLAFAATAGRQDVRLNRVVFVADAGSLLYGRNYRLLVNRSGAPGGDTVVATGIADSDHLTFDLLLKNGDTTLPVGVPVPFVVLADLPPDLGPVPLKLAFSTDLPDYVSAQGSEDGLDLEGVSTDGVCRAPNCFISVSTTPASTLTINTSGTLTVTADTLPVRSHILITGSSTPELLRIRFHAEGENIEVRMIGIDGITSGIDAVQLYKLSPGHALDPAHDVPFARATTSQCPASVPTRACANLGVASLTVTPDSDIIIGVAATLLGNRLGGVSGNTVTLSLTGATGTTDHGVEAVGASSKRTLAQNDGSAPIDGEILIGLPGPGPNVAITGSTNRTATASFSDIVREGPAQAYVSTGFSDIGSFRLSAAALVNEAAASSDVRIKSITFQVGLQNVQFDPAGFSLATADTPSVAVPCTGSSVSGTIMVSCQNLDDGTINSRIPQGGWIILTLRGNIVNPQIVDHSLSSIQTTLSPLGQPAMTNAILWSDGTTTFSWVDIPETSVSGTSFQSR